MQFNGFHHIGLHVLDFEKSLRFYQGGLGGKVILSFPMNDSGTPIRLVDLGNNAVIEIIPRGNGNLETDAHWAHIAVATDDTHAAYDRAVKAGAETQQAPFDVQLGSLSACIAFVLGPDKEVIEFFQVKAEG